MNRKLGTKKKKEVKERLVVPVSLQLNTGILNYKNSLNLYSYLNIICLLLLHVEKLLYSLIFGLKTNSRALQKAKGLFAIHRKGVKWNG